VGRRVGADKLEHAVILVSHQKPRQLRDATRNREEVSEAIPRLIIGISVEHTPIEEA
jgi:hypothetical protein